MSYIAITQYHASSAIDHGHAGNALATADTMAELADLVTDMDEFADGGDGLVLVDTGERFRRMDEHEHEAWHDALMMV